MLYGSCSWTMNNYRRAKLLRHVDLQNQENAIWHGLLPKSGEKHIQIHFTYLGNKTISCVIDDNGVGRKKTTTQPIVQKSSSLAISFIRQRLELMSKIKNVNLTLEVIDKVDDSNNSKGTKIIIILPIV